ncbi:hypothetical protein AAFF_G00427730 [Aldrovandia affinis]|uniref:Extracellular matrix protein 1 n=1 Tax=Aldrovandia affinis TaxID=143900 RepID=A0AAD7WIX6_9TELE|nr:hypothetical protein AAFF_G00427730 [Aldrovandia affinis]
MGSVVLRSSWIVVTVLAFVCSALEDEPDMTQREVDLSEILGGKGKSQLDPDMTQREVTFDLEDLWEPIELPEMDSDVTQREVTFDLPKILRERGSKKGGPDMTHREVTHDIDGGFEEMGPAVIVPRSFQDNRFPPARPSLSNLPAICLYGEGRPRYSLHSLPQTGFSYITRQEKTINRVESWYSVCCQRNGTQEPALLLCCARKAWEQAINGFCDEEFSIKTKHYHCCKMQGWRRWSCFDKEAPNRSYQPTRKGSVAPQSHPEQGFTWNPNTCQRKAPISSGTDTAPRSPKRKITREPDIRFPPGRPTSSNIGLVCRLRKLRPRYSAKCLPSTGYGWLARQLKAINRMEKGIKQCCKGQNEVLACTVGKWQEVMDRYCKEEYSVKTRRFPCCKMAEGHERYACFSSRAPDPEYTYEMLPHIVDHILPTLDLVCDTHKQLTKRSSVPFPIKSFVSQCCPLPAAQINACVKGQLNDLRESMCTAEPLSPALTPSCCHHDAPNCLSQLLLDAISDAIHSPNFKKKKCPLI